MVAKETADKYLKTRSLYNEPKHNSHIPQNIGRKHILMSLLKKMEDVEAYRSPTKPMNDSIKNRIICESPAKI